MRLDHAYPVLFAFSGLLDLLNLLCVMIVFDQTRLEKEDDTQIFIHHLCVTVTVTVTVALAASFIQASVGYISRPLSGRNQHNKCVCTRK